MGVSVPEEEEAEEMEAGTTLETTLETVERSTVGVRSETRGGGREG